ncbi:MAG TPA: FliH/SctL family protein [Bryobacteraceae bacterium]|nr:FliH/SctL family protein [Bryobacteraceae bacterium]
MSSKLHRGGVSAEPIGWRSVGAVEGNHCVVPGLQGATEYVPRQPESSRRGSVSADDSEEKIQAAHQQGVEQGRAAERKETAAQLEAMNLRMARAIEEMSGLRKRFRHEAEEDVVALALAIARRILHRELTMAPDALLGLVKAALEKMEAREVHKVRIRPEDAAMVRQFLEKMGLPQKVEVVADPGLERGAAILDSSRGALDASVETQLEEIERGLADLVRRV